MVVAGLDIGTTHCSVAVWQNGKVNVIANDQGFRATPAYVCFEGDEVIVGDTAVHKQHSLTASTVCHLKRVLGKTHAEVVDQPFVKQWPFSLVAAEDGSAVAKTTRNGDADATVSPVEFLSFLMRNLTDLAADFTGEKVDCTVVTVPAQATDKQKALIQEAAKLADIKVLSYLSEPLAAAIAYELDEPAKDAPAEYALVFDLGGATLDLTLLLVDKGLFEVVATRSLDHVGGEDFTQAAFEHCARAFKRKTKLDVTTSAKAMSRLRVACETAKRSLSTQNQVNIEVDSLMEGEDFALKLSRPRFEELIADQVKTAVQAVDALLEEADLDKESIDRVICVGGSSRIPLVYSSLQSSFDGVPFLNNISPDEVIAHGAAIEASARVDLYDCDFTASELQHANAVPLTLSVGLANGSVSELIHRDAVLPVTATEVFTTSADNQEAVFIQIFEGERALQKDNTLLAQLSVTGISPLPKGEAEISVTFTVANDGSLSVTAEEATAGSKSLEVQVDDSARLTADDIARLVKEAEDAADEDNDVLDALEAEEDADETEVAVEAVASAPAAVAPSSEDLD